jgi:hypothetical protein
VHPAVYYSVHENWGEHICDFNASDAPDGPRQRAFEDLAMAQLGELAAKFGGDLAGIWFDAGVRQAPPFVQVGPDSSLNTFALLVAHAYVRCYAPSG